MSLLSFLTAILTSSLLLCGHLGVEAALVMTNIDTEEPSLIRSPAVGSGDGFGWAAVFHQFQTVSESDSMAMSLDNTRQV